MAFQALGEAEPDGGRGGEHDQRVGVLAVAVEPGRAEAGLAQRPLHQLHDRGRGAVQHEPVDAVCGAVTVQHGERPVREARIGSGLRRLLGGRAPRCRGGPGSGPRRRRGGSLRGVYRLHRGCGRFTRRRGRRRGGRGCRGRAGDGVLRCPSVQQPLVGVQARRLRLAAAVLPVLHRLGRRLQRGGQAGLRDTGSLTQPGPLRGRRQVRLLVQQSVDGREQLFLRSHALPPSPQDPISLNHKLTPLLNLPAPRRVRGRPAPGCPGAVFLISGWWGGLRCSVWCRWCWGLQSGWFWLGDGGVDVLAVC